MRVSKYIFGLPKKHKAPYKYNKPVKLELNASKNDVKREDFQEIMTSISFKE